MITLKTGVPGSGKTLSMVAELLAESKAKEPRPVYTNITDLTIPHIHMRNWEPGTKREEGVLYTIDWRECPHGSIIIIDEAFLYGYDGKSAQAAVPDYIRDLAIHRKDYSVDIWFIVQAPKALHVALRRQVGKHQHYRRLFGSNRAIVYEWDQCQDNLSATKTAVISYFYHSKSAFKAYKSAEVHTKPKFKLPWFVWIPVALIPLAAWAIPNAYHAMSGAMSGKGLQGAATQSRAAPAPSLPVSAPAAVQPPGASVSMPPGGLPPGVQIGAAAPAQVLAGCIVANHVCGCFDAHGKKVTVEESVCSESTGQGKGPPAQFADSTPSAAAMASLVARYDRPYYFK